jgi:hypothetical protein
MPAQNCAPAPLVPRLTPAPRSMYCASTLPPLLFALALLLTAYAAPSSAQRGSLPPPALAARDSVGPRAEAMAAAHRAGRARHALQQREQQTGVAYVPGTP